jgi:hypothetical protein
MENTIEIVRIRNKFRKTLNELHTKDICIAISELFADKKAIDYFKYKVEKNIKDTCMSIDSEGYLISLKHSYAELFSVYKNHKPSNLFARLNNAMKNPDYKKDKRFHMNCIYKTNRMFNDWISELPLNISDDFEIDNFDLNLVFVSYDFKMKKFYIFQYSRIDLANDFFNLFDRTKYSIYTKMNRGYYFNMVCISPEYLVEIVDILAKNNYKTSLIVSAAELENNNISLDVYLEKLKPFYKVPNKYFLINGNDKYKFDDKYFIKD